MDANEAFHLFADLRDLLVADLPEESDVDIAGLVGCHAVTLRTVGPRSKGLSVLGRRGDTLSGDERGHAVTLARAVGAVCHAVETASGPESAPETLRVLVTTSGGQAEAEVAVGLAAEVRTGRGRDESPLAAVARAAIDTVDPTIQLVHATRRRSAPRFPAPIPCGPPPTRLSRQRRGCRAEPRPFTRGGRRKWQRVGAPRALRRPDPRVSSAALRARRHPCRRQCARARRPARPTSPVTPSRSVRS